ncbi:MAG: radical SAM protein [Acidobacteriota bacterium]
MKDIGDQEEALTILSTLKSRYYVSDERDPLPVKAFRRLTSRKVPSFPRTVQIQTQTGCNAACVFCPYPDTVDTQPKGRMPPELFEQIIDEIARHGVRRISPYLMNEPFLDRGIIEKMQYIHKKIPDARLVLTTNGSRLTPDLVNRLVALECIHAVYISFQGVEKEGYEATMRGSMVFEKTMENVLHLADRWKAAGGRDRFKLVVTMVATRLIDPEKAVAFWRERGVDSKYTPLENRGGNIGLARDISRNGMQAFSTCTRLFKQAYIMFNGDMVLCCTDYSREEVLGNIRGSSIEAVWNSPRAVQIRRDYTHGRFDRLPLCSKCEIADSTGDEEFE